MHKLSALYKACIILIIYSKHYTVILTLYTKMYVVTSFHLRSGAWLVTYKMYKSSIQISSIRISSKKQLALNHYRSYVTHFQESNYIKRHKKRFIYYREPIAQLALCYTLQYFCILLPAYSYNADRSIQPALSYRLLCLCSRDISMIRAESD